MNAPRRAAPPADGPKHEAPWRDHQGRTPAGRRHQGDRRRLDRRHRRRPRAGAARGHEGRAGGLYVLRRACGRCTAFRPRVGRSAPRWTSRARRIEALVVDPAAVSKVRHGVYKGFSIGGRVLARDPADRKVITRLKLNEIKHALRGLESRRADLQASPLRGARCDGMNVRPTRLSAGHQLHALGHGRGFPAIWLSFNRSSPPNPRRRRRTTRHRPAPRLRCDRTDRAAGLRGSVAKKTRKTAPGGAASAASGALHPGPVPSLERATKPVVRRHARSGGFECSRSPGAGGPR